MRSSAATNESPRAGVRRTRVLVALGHRVTALPTEERSADDSLDSLDRLELRDLGAALLPVRWDAHMRAQLVLGLVDKEPLGRRVGELDQRPAGAAHVDRVEVAAILDVGDIGEAEADDPVLDRRLVLGGDRIQRMVMDRSLAELPRALG